MKESYLNNTYMNGIRKAADKISDWLKKQQETATSGPEHDFYGEIDFYVTGKKLEESRKFTSIYKSISNN